jgi:glucose-1-phosphate adenylyltransferase
VRPPLTADRAKPAVPFGGNYRLVDFALEPRERELPPEVVLSSTRATASTATSCHLAAVAAARQLRDARPAQTRRGLPVRRQRRRIYQNYNLIADERPTIIVFGADHIYRMDPRQMVEQHIESGAGSRSPRSASRANRRSSSA